MLESDENLTISVEAPVEAPPDNKAGSSGGCCSSTAKASAQAEYGGSAGSSTVSAQAGPGSGSSASTMRAKAAAFALALLVFACANLVCSSFGNKATDGNLGSIGNRTWSWWTLNHLQKLHSSPNVVLLGSSLMVAAIVECDATYKGKRIDMAYYRDAAYLSSALQKSFGGQFSTVNLSAPGQMPSDAYLTMVAALKQGVRPNVVFYGLAPRDFIDATLRSPTDTEAFQLLQHFVDIDNCAFDLYLTPAGRLDWLLQKCTALYARAYSARSTLQTLAANALPSRQTSQKVTPLQLYLKRTLTPLAVDAGIAFTQPTRPGTAMFDDITIYKLRYKNPDPSIYRAQFRFLQRLADLCKKEQIKLVLVEMPITERNVSLIKPRDYQAYKSDLSLMAEHNRLPLLHLCQFECYDFQSDYKDSVHLNGYGGKKFVDHLVSHLSTSPTMADEMVAVSKSGNQRALAASGAARM